MRSRLLPVGIALFLAAAVVGLWRSSHRAPGEVRIAYLPIIPSLPVFVVQEQHLFEKENLKVAMLSLNSNNDLVNALVAGQADLRPCVPTTPIVHREIQHPGLVRVFSHSRMNENNALDKIIVKENSSRAACSTCRAGRWECFRGTAPQKMLVTLVKKHGVNTETISFVQLAPQVQLSSLELVRWMRCSPTSRLPRLPWCMAGIARCSARFTPTCWTRVRSGCR